MDNTVLARPVASETALAGDTPPPVVVKLTGMPLRSAFPLFRTNAEMVALVDPSAGMLALLLDSVRLETAPVVPPPDVTTVNCAVADSPPVVFAVTVIVSPGTKLSPAALNVVAEAPFLSESTIAGLTPPLLTEKVTGIDGKSALVTSRT
jgi:hypothetical protein